MNLLSGVHFNRLEGAVQASVARQNTIANNIANVDTPYFKRSDVEFEHILRQQMTGGTLQGTRTDERHFYIGANPMTPSSRIVRDETEAMNNNKNNVDMDREMSMQAENQLRYYTFVQQVNHHINMMKTSMDVRR
ncbi:flagellar basal body rod protein FlgB [Paenibacillus sp. 481]|uniref:flagellar basal body rod protein FlgB n=1 Tax=Paenibacillus sp. 481 TaxID=2835869 RepID=UPI001E2E38CC|nr:flagellar basal body rod protein FlgB [Paenibacillus sp. 481]UHA73942.1 flagellar basal body rod protein FlgB [Paenibacillus sp. 481]